MNYINKIIASWLFISIFVSCEKEPEVPPTNSPEIPSPGYVFELQSGNNLYGQITDAKTGNPIAGIPVSDGYNYVKTDKGGYYQMKAYQATGEHARTVSVSVPADYELPFGSDGLPAFYQYIQRDAEGLCRRDFTLTKRAEACDNFTIMALADIHIQKNDHLVRFQNETLPDLLNTIQTGEQNGCYKNTIVITLGDNVWDNSAQYAPVKQALSSLKCPNGRTVNLIPCIGNHDTMQKEGTTDFAVTQRYVDNFGPLDFSFDIGKVHVIFMKNFVRSGEGSGNTTETKGGLLETQFNWLKKDIEMVKDKKNKLLIYCGHYPVHEMTRIGGGTQTEFYSLLQQFREVHCFTGHHHGVYNNILTSYESRAGYPIYDHNQVSAGGAWWNSHLNPDGVPNGYMIYNISGNSLSEWYFKATDQQLENCQLRIYDGAEKYNTTSSWLSGKQYSWATMVDEMSFGETLTDKYIVKVFDADSKNWTVELEQDAKKVPLTRVNSNIYDICTYVYAYDTYPLNSSYHKNEYTRYKVKNTNYWYVDKSKIDLNKEWVVRAIHTQRDGSKTEYLCSKIHKGYDEF